MTALIAVVMALAAISAIGVVLSPQTIYSALSLVVTVTMISVLFLLLHFKEPAAQDAQLPTLNSSSPCS